MGEEAAGELISSADALSLDELYNEKLLLRATKKEPGLCGGGQPPQCSTSSVFVKRGGFVLKTFLFVCSHEKRSLLKAASI